MTTSRWWAVGTLLGLAIWIGTMVLVAVVNNNASNPVPVLLTFAGGGVVFFGVVFGAALWQTRPKREPELDVALAELSLDGNGPALSASALRSTRRTARAYLWLGVVVTAIGLWLIVQSGLGLPGVPVTVVVFVVIVVGWAAAVPYVLRATGDSSRVILGRLGLEQQGTDLVGVRHGRAVRVRLSAAGSKVTVQPTTGEAVTIERDGNTGAHWLLDLREAEQRLS